MTQRRLVQEVVYSYRERYSLGSRKERTQILDELCRTYRRPRKSFIRLFGRAKRTSSVLEFEKRTGRPERYGTEHMKWAAELWEAMGLMNSKAMKVAFEVWLPQMLKGENAIPKNIYEDFLVMSASTLDRLLKNHRRAYWKKHRSATKSSRGYIRFFKETVPLRKFEEKPTKPGFMEADTVAHCGESMAGHFIWTLNMTDVVTGWCEQRAVWAKHQDFTLDAVIDIQAGLPFKMYALHTDNGWEFLNHLFVDHFSKPESEVHYTRGRPYFKQDQACVEQKNFTHVRKILGYERLDQPGLLTLINDIYKNEHRLLMNFFVPQTKLISKTRVGPKKIKKFDTPKTPYQRLLDSKEISETTKKALSDTFQSLNPFQLQKQLQQKLKLISDTLKKLEKSDDQQGDKKDENAA